MAEGEERWLTDGVQFFLGGYAMVFSLFPTAIEMRSSQGVNPSLERKSSGLADAEAPKARPIGHSSDASSSAKTSQSHLPGPASSLLSSKVSIVKDEDPTDSQASAPDWDTSSQVSLAPTNLEPSRVVDESLNISVSIAKFEDKDDDEDSSAPREPQEATLTNSELDRRLFGNEFVPRAKPLSTVEPTDPENSASPSSSQAIATSQARQAQATPLTPASDSSSTETLDNQDKQSSEPSKETQKATSRPQSPPDSPGSLTSSQTAVSAHEPPSTMPTDPETLLKSSESAMDVDKVSSQPSQSSQSPLSTKTAISSQSSLSTQSSTSTQSRSILTQGSEDKDPKQANVESPAQDAPKTPEPTISSQNEFLDILDAVNALNRAKGQSTLAKDKQAHEIKSEKHSLPSTPSSSSASTASSPKSPEKDVQAHSPPSTPLRERTEPATAPESTGRRLHFSIVARSTPYVLGPSSKGAVFLNADDPLEPTIKPVETSNPILFGSISSAPRANISPAKPISEWIDEYASADDMPGDGGKGENGEMKPPKAKRAKPKTRYTAEDSRTPQQVASKMRKPLVPYDPAKVSRRQPDRAARHAEHNLDPSADEASTTSQHAGHSKSQARDGDSDAGTSAMDVDEPAHEEDDSLTTMDLDNFAPHKTPSSAKGQLKSAGQTPKSAKAPADQPQVVVSPPKRPEPPVAIPIVLSDPLDPHILENGKVNWGTVLACCVILEPSKSLEIASLVQMGQTGEHEFDKESTGSMLQVQARFKVDGVKSFLRGILLSDPKLLAASKAPATSTASQSSSSDSPAHLDDSGLPSTRTRRSLLKHEVDDGLSKGNGHRSQSPLGHASQNKNGSKHGHDSEDLLRRRPRTAHMKQHENFDDHADNDRDEHGKRRFAKSAVKVKVKRVLNRSNSSGAIIKKLNTETDSEEEVEGSIDDFPVADRQGDSDEMDNIATFCRWAGARVKFTISDEPPAVSCDFFSAVDAFTSAATELKARETSHGKVSASARRSAEGVALSALSSLTTPENPNGLTAASIVGVHAYKIDQMAAETALDFINRDGPLTFTESGRPSRRAKPKSFVTPEQLLDQPPPRPSRAALNRARRNLEAEKAAQATKDVLTASGAAAVTTAALEALVATTNPIAQDEELSAQEALAIVALEARTAAIEEDLSSAPSASNPKKRRPTEDAEDLESLPAPKKRSETLVEVIAEIKKTEANFEIPIATAEV